ncbi:MAG: phospholipase D family protein [Muribaculaceae bacterium]|nr:phospholipase D family protein [Muribaculaceae bacterium]
MTTFISDGEHYAEVLASAVKARRSLWIGTADIKDLYVIKGGREMPLLGVLAEMIRRGVNVRLLHAKEPGPNFLADFDRYPSLSTGLERAMCPRVHFKIIVIDQTACYVGSANLTGAGMGMKADSRRNFEAGILTDDPAIVTAAIEEFDKVWRGSACLGCQRRRFCPDPIK